MTTAIASARGEWASTVADIESFSANGTTYIVAALRYDGTTYAIASKLYRWTGSAIEEMQDIPSDGAEDWGGDRGRRPNLRLPSQQFPRGQQRRRAAARHVRDGLLHLCVQCHGQCPLAGRILHDRGARGASRCFASVAKTYVAVANSYNDTHSRIASTLYRFDPDESVGRSVLTRLQEIPTGLCLDMAFFHAQRRRMGDACAGVQRIDA